MSHAIRSALIAATLLALAACKPATAPGADTAAAPSATPAQEQAAANPVAAVAGAVLPSAKDTVVAAMRKFTAASSYHADMHLEGGARGPMDNAIDFVAPDRYRMSMAGVGEQVIIGDTMYMTMRGRTMQAPMPPGTLEQWRAPGKLAEAEANMAVEDQGSDPVDGMAATRYLVRVSGPNPAETTLWIGDDGLPLQVVANNPMGKVTLRYSRINDPSIVIEAPK